MGEKSDCRHRNREKQNDESPLDKEISRAAPQQHRNFHHAMLHHGITKRERIKRADNNQDCVDPERWAVLRKINCRALYDQRHHADQGAPKNHAGFAPDDGIGTFCKGVHRERYQPQSDQDIAHINQRQANVFSHCSAKQVRGHAGLPQITGRHSGQRPCNAKDHTDPFQPGDTAIHGRASREDREKNIKQGAKHCGENRLVEEGK